MDIRKVEPKRIVASYFLIQAFGTFGWWCLLWFRRDSIRFFQPEQWPQEVLLSFFLSDLVFLIFGSLATAFVVLHARSWATTLVWFMVGAAWYPALYCVGASVLTGEAWIASSLMVAMAGFMLAVATILGTDHQLPSAIRVVPMDRVSAGLWTALQIAIFWSVFLWVLPQGLAELQRKLGWQSFAHELQFECSLVVFVLASMVGLWSALAMVIGGNGTPLPTATAPDLVSAGPYRYVRNPMALAGVFQGVAVGWMFGSWLVISGAVVCGLGWHLLVRPIEETDLLQRFGEDYKRYQQTVGLWVPRLPKP